MKEFKATFTSGYNMTSIDANPLSEAKWRPLVTFLSAVSVYYSAALAAQDYFLSRSLTIVTLKASCT